MQISKKNGRSTKNEKSNKVRFSILITAMMFFIFTGCAERVEELQVENKEKKEISLVAPNGVPATAISKMIKENIQVDDSYNVNYSIENTSETLATSVMKGEPDIQ